MIYDIDPPPHHPHGAAARHGRRFHRGGPHPHRGGYRQGDTSNGLPRFGRKLRAEDSRLVLLALLEAGPSHGYDLIGRLAERSGGFYAPSSGVIYPALAELEALGHVSATEAGNRKLYAITAQGGAHLAALRPQADAILETLGRIGGRMEEVRDAFAGVAEPGAEADTLHEARHALKHAMRAHAGAPPSTLVQIAAILQEAADRITALRPPAPRGPEAR